MNKALAVLCGSIALGMMTRASVRADAPTPAKSITALPPKVRALMPPGAKSLILTQLPYGPLGASMLVHIWTTVRPKGRDEGNTYDRWHPSPVCVDFFTAGEKPGSWSYATSAAYMDSNAPGGVTARWLQPNKKQGLVLIIGTGNGAPGVSGRKVLITFPYGAQDGYNALVQDFWSGGSGGGSISQKYGIDSRGYMTVVEEEWRYGKKHSSKAYAWDGKSFSAR